jgi:hypothetical protein
MSSAMDIRTNTGRTPSVLDRYTSYSQMQPNHDLLSPRFFAGTPAPNEYNLKSYLGKHLGTSMKGNRTNQNFGNQVGALPFVSNQRYANAIVLAV